MKIKKEKDDGRCSKEKVIFLYFYPTSNKTNRKHIFFFIQCDKLYHTVSNVKMKMILFLI